MFEKEFSRIRGEVKITQASRDGGVDAVAYDNDPVRGGKIVIQAKRYAHTVGVSAVRDLYGTVQHEGAMKGILVTTASFGSDAYEFAKDKPLTLISGLNCWASLSATDTAQGLIWLKLVHFIGAHKGTVSDGDSLSALSDGLILTSSLLSLYV